MQSLCRHVNGVSDKFRSTRRRYAVQQAESYGLAFSQLKQRLEDTKNVFNNERTQFQKESAHTHALLERANETIHAQAALLRQKLPEETLVLSSSQMQMQKEA